MVMETRVSSVSRGYAEWVVMTPAGSELEHLGVNVKICPVPWRVVFVQPDGRAPTTDRGGSLRLRSDRWPTPNR